jgi:hypothetical protein
VNALRLKNVLLCGLLIALTLNPIRGASFATQQADPLELVPATSIFCLRINNFEYNIGQLDQFIAGFSPIPMGLSMLVRMQLGGILGDPQLAGVNMNGTFAAFAVPMPGAGQGAESAESQFFAMLVPVTDYDSFLASANVGRPDARGISQITSQGIPPTAVKQAGAFALITGAENADTLATIADSVLSARSAAIKTVPAVADSDITDAPIWIYIDAKEAAKRLAPIAEAQMGAAGAMPGAPGQMTPSPGGPIQSQPAAPDAMQMMPGMANFDITSMAAGLPFESLILGIEPKPNLLTVMARATAIPGSEAAQTFVRGSADMQALFDFIGAKPPSQMGADMSAVLALLPKANQADAVGKYDLMQLTKLADNVPIPINLPAQTIPSKSAIAYAVTADNGKLAADIAFPKEHVAEIAEYLKQAFAGGMSSGMPEAVEIDMTQRDVFDTQDTQDTQDEPNDDISMITASPFGNLPSNTLPPSNTAMLSNTIPSSNTIEIQPGEVAMPTIDTDTTLFGGAGFDGVTSTAAPARAADQMVRVAGVRLVRYANLKLGVLPLGRGDGYTLSLIADLPAPAVKIAGGQIEKAMTNDGKNLLPANEWDRKVRFARISKDYKTAVFDIELLLPDPGALGIEELAGTLEYFTASGTKNIDLGLLELKAGVQASQLGAKISSIDIDAYKNNPPVVALTLNVSDDVVESVELYDEQDKRIEIIRYGSVSLGKTTTLKFFVEDDLPAQVKIVVHIFEGLEKHTLPFSIKAISIAGLPMR